MVGSERGSLRGRVSSLSKTMDDIERGGQSDPTSGGVQVRPVWVSREGYKCFVGIRTKLYVLANGSPVS